MARSRAIRLVVKPVVFSIALVPFAWLAWDAVAGNLSANPIEDITHRTGDWTLRFLLITLAITPARRLLRWSDLIQFRRMLGLFAFFYAAFHFSTYLVLDQFFSLADIVDDVAKRPFITVGFTSFLLLIPLAVTSTKKMVKRLGGKRWSQLHRLVYVAAAGGILHYLWLVKADVRLPVTYGLILVTLLAMRVRWSKRVRVKTARTGRAPPSREPIPGAARAEPGP